MTSHIVAAFVAVAAIAAAEPALAYPPGVGILSKSRTCTSCHTATGPWGDEAKTVVDVLDGATRKSLRQPDGTFRIEVTRHEARTVLTLLGRLKGDAKPITKTSWIYVDPSQIATRALSKFAPGWDVNLPGACRIVGDKAEGYEGAPVTLLPMTVRPGDAARDGEVELQVLLVSGDGVKGDAKAPGLVANYLMRPVKLKVIDAAPKVLDPAPEPPPAAKPGAPVPPAK